MKSWWPRATPRLRNKCLRPEDCADQGLNVENPKLSNVLLGKEGDLILIDYISIQAMALTLLSQSQGYLSKPMPGPWTMCGVLFTIHLSKAFMTWWSTKATAWSWRYRTNSAFPEPRHLPELPSPGFEEGYGPREDIITNNKATTGGLTLVCKLKFCFWAWSMWFKEIKFPFMKSPYLEWNGI